METNLVERVARAICYNPPICACDDMSIACCSKFAHERSVAAIRVVVEECARIAEHHASNLEEDTSELRSCLDGWEAREIASAIRALLEDGND